MADGKNSEREGVREPDEVEGQPYRGWKSEEADETPEGQSIPRDEVEEVEGQGFARGKPETEGQAVRWRTEEPDETPEGKGLSPDDEEVEGQGARTP